MPSANFAGASADTVPSSAPANRRNLSIRILSGLALGPPVLLLAILGGTWFGLASAIAAAIGFREWLRIVDGRPHLLGFVAPAAVMMIYWGFGVAAALEGLAVAAVTVGVVGLAARSQNPWFGALGMPYVGLTMITLPWLRASGDAGWKLVLFVLFVVWASDIGAFFVGRAIGGPRLAPRISPNKTWSGLVGAAVVAAGVALGWALILQIRAPLYAMIVAIGLSLIGQGGDLFESSVKRRFRLKDSGELIPGHGGMLDRIDALLWAAPVFALFHAMGGTAGWTP